MYTLKEIHSLVVQENTANLIAELQHLKNTTKTHSLSAYFLTNFTINTIDHILNFYLYHSNLTPDIKWGQYDNAMQEVLDPHSILHTQKFDLIVYSHFYDSNDPSFLMLLNEPQLFINNLTSLLDLLKQKTNALILVNTLLFPFFSEKGITSTPQDNIIDKIIVINQFIRNYIKENSGRFFLMDWVRYVQLLGKNDSMDYRYWYMHKSPFKKHFLSYYAADIARVARALKGYAKKCLILDCDNTLWGGIVGEEGYSGIQLDNHNYPGKIFYDFQNSLLELANQGVILALCSKNNENDVWEIFDKHPYSLLKRSHIAAHRINWLNKVDNIIDLVKELNIAQESCVFIDDSPVECELVRSILPNVTVLQVPAALYDYPTLLFQEGLFDKLTISDNDLTRNLNYQQESLRKAAYTSATNLIDYLASLELVATVHPLKRDEIPRVAQLTQKTNQFNLSTKRYTQTQIEDFYNSIENAIYTLSVRDKFGCYGLTGVLIAKKQKASAIIDTFLMSCRILSRNLEYVFLEKALKELATKWHLYHWQAEYIPSEKNQQIVDFLTKANFQINENGIYCVDLSNWKGFNIDYVQVVQEGFEYA